MSCVCQPRAERLAAAASCRAAAAGRTGFLRPCSAWAGKGTCKPFKGTCKPFEGRMELLGAVLLAASLLGTAARGAQAPWPDEPSHTCFFQTLSSPDSEFCRGDLEVTYPQLGDVGCSYIPQCHQYRWRLSREWGSPRVRYPRADKSKKYVLMLVDPDAPSRADPRNRFWRHWLLADVRGTDLRTGDLKGRVLTGEWDGVCCHLGWAQPGGRTGASPALLGAVWISRGAAGAGYHSPWDSGQRWRAPEEDGEHRRGLTVVIGESFTSSPSHRRWWLCWGCPMGTGTAGHKAQARGGLQSAAELWLAGGWLKQEPPLQGFFFFF
uniref:Phosphatidylethanolamine binding protein 4 n=2 Tax=Anser cygnoides TaxID=8845 RepID=A0A8B9IPE8_ANSCY